jgi:hypothetical protein
MLPAMPDRPSGMDHEFGRKFIAFGYLSLPGGTTTECAAFCKQVRPRCPMDSSINAATTQQCSIRSVHYCVHALLGDVPLYYVNSIRLRLIFHSLANVRSWGLMSRAFL